MSVRVLTRTPIFRSGLSTTNRSVQILSRSSILTSSQLPVLVSKPFSTSSIAKMVAPAGLMSNRYKIEEMPDLTGKIAVVTGGSRGIGEALVSALVQKGCQVHILSATKSHADQAIANITKVAPDAPKLITHHQVDLGTLSSVISLAKELASTLPRLDMLYCIAGIGVAPFGLTNDGVGNHFGVNHLASMVLVDNLLGLLKETSEKKQGTGADVYEKYSTRIVAESSELHRASPNEVKFDDLEEVSTDMDETLLYGRSKLMAILFIRELTRRHLPSITSTSPILALATHPGAVATEQQKGATEAYGLLGKALEIGANMVFMSKEQGCESALWAGVGKTVAERKEEVQGRYFTEADGKVDTESDQAKSDELARKLWDLSVKVLKDKVGYQVQM
ncbi:hypothetical protein IAR55_007036 [Kwoniella newhampshirensis]|uniref:NAD(P)-binding protein n=1 Tax=Kwoniella newhampshirensis TaxID=1651941 RepID=A0AAW0YDE7_9TREE